MTRNLTKEQKKQALLIGKLWRVQNTKVEEKIRGYLR